MTSNPGLNTTAVVRGILAAALAALIGFPAVSLRAQEPGAEVRRFATVADLCAADDLAPDAIVAATGYRKPDDGGGGQFRYDPRSEAAPDGGSVLQPGALPGRLHRIVHPDAPAFAEWFGAYRDGDGDAPHDDREAINACLRAYGRVSLREGTYGVGGTPQNEGVEATYRALDLGPDYRITGAGRDKTTVKLLDGTNPHGDVPANNYFCVFANRRFHESADYVIVRDLTIDCNFDGQNKHTTINAIGIRGGGALVERVNFRGYGTGRHPETGDTRECFVVHQGLVYKDAEGCRRTAVLRDLDFTSPGHNGSVGGHVAEITLIALGGANNFDDLGWILPTGHDPDFDPADGGENRNNWWPAYGGLVENCFIHDQAYDPETQKSPLHGITYGDCIGLTIRGNRVENFEGSGIFTMSWWNRDTVIVDNDFTGVTSAMDLLLQSHEGQPVQHPRHNGVLFAHNRVVLGSDPDAPWGTCGINLFGGDMPADTRMSGIHIRDNTISGRAHTNAKGERACPLGIKLQILRAVYHDIRIEDNTLDLPDYGSAAYVPQEPHAQALFFFPIAHWENAVAAGHVRYRGNRSPDGKALYPFLADWYFRNEPTWGRP